ncbi:MAG: SgcJ/EcaC family oxidoreductase [Bacteroidota bacterium]
MTHPTLPSFRQTHMEQPEDMPLKFQEAWKARNAIQLANLFSEDAQFVNVVGLWWHRREDIWKAHDYGLRVIFQDSQVKLGRILRTDLTPEVVLIHARMHLVGQTPQGDVQKPNARQNLFSFVMQRYERGWVCRSAHNTDVVPGKETNIIDGKGHIQSVDYRKQDPS